MDRASLKLQIEGAVQRPLSRGMKDSSPFSARGFLRRKRRLMAESDADETSSKRFKVCESERPLDCAGKSSKGSQTWSAAIPRLPTASRSFPVPWGVVRRSSSSSSTQTVSSPRLSSIDDLCDIPDADDFDILFDEVFASDDECMQGIMAALHYLSDRKMDDAMPSTDAAESSVSGAEGAIVCSVSDGRRDVATSTSNVSLRATRLPPPRRRAWREASRGWRSNRSTCSSSTQTDFSSFS